MAAFTAAVQISIHGAVPVIILTEGHFSVLDPQQKQQKGNAVLHI